MKSKVLSLIAAVFILTLTGVLNSQSITNTLGTSGSFQIKDGLLTYFTLTQSNGYVELNKSLKIASTTDLNTGVIYKGANRFIHDYKFSLTLGHNLFVGVNSGNFTLGSFNFPEASLNCGFGSNTLNALTTGSGNVALGYNSLPLNTSGQYNIAIGPFSMQSSTQGSFNIGIGGNSLNSNTTGVGNVGVGYGTMVNIIDATQNCAFGSNALSGITSGSSNVAIGSGSMQTGTTGFNNTAVGHSTLGFTTGNHNTALGYNSGSNVTTGTNLTLIGNSTQPSTGTVNNQITLGNNSVTSLRCNVQTITSLSDARDKKNVNSLSFGLGFLMKLQPRQFNWDKREWYDGNVSDGCKTETTMTAGFIAQELDEVQSTENAEWLKLVFKDNPERWEATYGNLLPVMVKAIQELKLENDNIKAENEQLKKEIEQLKSVEDRLTLLELTVLKQNTLKEIKSAAK